MSDLRVLRVPANTDVQSLLAWASAVAHPSCSLLMVVEVRVEQGLLRERASERLALSFVAFVCFLFHSCPVLSASVLSNATCIVPHWKTVTKLGANCLLRLHILWLKVSFSNPSSDRLCVIRYSIPVLQEGSKTQ